MDILSTVFGFVIGVIVGAVGAHLWRTHINQEAIAKVNNLFGHLWRQHTNLLQEMKQDMENPDYKFHREFYVLKKNQRFSLSLPKPCLAYFSDEFDNLDQQLKTLETYGMITNVTEPNKDFAKYQFNENFVELLRNKKN